MASGQETILTRSAELRFDTSWTPSITSLFGVYADKSDTTANTLTTIVPFNLSAPAYLSSSNIDEAAFGTLFYKLTDTINLSAGLRYDVQRLTANTDALPGGYKASTLEPRFTIDKHWNPDFMTYASVAKGVRGGGANGPGAPNPIYQGDSVWTYEVGTKFSAFRHRLSMDSDVFYNDYSNFIGQNALAPSTTGVGYVAVNLNSGQMQSYGWEAELHARPIDPWHIDAGITLMHARVTNDAQFVAVTGYPLSSNHVLFVPDWTFNFDTSYSVPLSDNDQLLFTFDSTGKGSRLGSSLNPAVAPFLQPYILVNPSITWQHDNLSVALFVTNLLDARYIESYLDQSVLERAGVAPPIASDLAIQGDRRRIGVRLSYRF